MTKKQTITYWTFSSSSNFTCQRKTNTATCWRDQTFLTQTRGTNCPFDTLYKNNIWVDWPHHWRPFQNKHWTKNHCLGATGFSCGLCVCLACAKAAAAKPSPCDSPGKATFIVFKTKMPNQTSFLITSLVRTPISISLENTTYVCQCFVFGRALQDNHFFSKYVFGNDLSWFWQTTRTIKFQSLGQMQLKLQWMSSPKPKFRSSFEMPHPLIWQICFGFLSKVGFIYDITSCIVVNPFSKIDSRMGLSVWYFACLVVVLLMFCWHAFCVLMLQFKIHMLGFSFHAINLTCHFSFVFYRPTSCMDAWGAFPTFCTTPNHIAPPKHRKWSTFLIAPPKKRTNDQNCRRFSGFKAISGSMSKSRTKTPNLHLTQPEPMSFWPNVAEMAPIRADITKKMLHPPKMPDNTVRTWFTHGSHMVRTWFAHGSRMVRTWFAHGSHMVRAWFGPLFAKIWNEISQKSKNAQYLTECTSQQGNFKKKKTTFWEFNRALSDARVCNSEFFPASFSKRQK